MRRRLGSVLAFVAAAALAYAQHAQARSVIHVPADEPTIQAGIDAAIDGDVVLVAAGTYFENIDFEGKKITVRGQSGRTATVIDGGHAGPVVQMNVTGAAVLRGFTIRNGSGEGGIVTSGGNALITHNLITNNTTCDSGGGISAAFSAAVIRGNVISDNHQEGCSGGAGGGGIIVRGAGTVQILDNQISGNSHGSWGGGISLFAAGNPVISGNYIRNNTAGGGGGGIWIVNNSNALIVNNVINGNSASDGGGIYWLVPSGSVGPAVINDTIGNNVAARGSAVFADGFDAGAKLTNDVLVGSAPGAVVYCGNSNDPNPPQISFDDVWDPLGGARYGGLCSDRTGQHGNISADPLFAARFHLQQGSPAIDAGSNAAGPSVDIDGDTRPIDGDGNGTAIVDMGADEFVPA